MNEAYCIYLCASWGFPLEVKGHAKAADFSISFSSVYVFVLWEVDNSSTSFVLEPRPGFAGGEARCIQSPMEQMLLEHHRGNGSSACSTAFYIRISVNSYWVLRILWSLIAGKHNFKVFYCCLHLSWYHVLIIGKRVSSFFPH